MNRTLIVIPAFDAESTLADVLDGVSGFTKEVLVVDDGSTDKTAEIARSYDWVKLEQMHPNQGKGAALAVGLKLAKELGYLTAITMDADNQHGPEELPKFVEAFKETGNQIIVGSRFEDESEGKRNVPVVRFLANHISSALLSWRLGTPMHDGQSGYRLYELTLVDLFEGMRPGFVWETEILLRAARKGYKLGTIPIRCCYPDGTKTSHYRSIKDSWEILRAIFRP